MPVFNEEKTICEILHRVLDSPETGEIMVINDGSTDGTGEMLSVFEKHPKVKVITHEKNFGKGMAVRTGIQHSRGVLILIQDADLEYDPRDYPRLLQPIREDLAEVVYGSRFLGEARRPLYFWNMVANKILIFITNILYNNILSDMETGYKLFKREVVDDLNLKSRGFDFEPEFTAKILKRGIRIFEVPIRFNPRLYSEGKKIKMKDAFIAFWTLLKYRFMD